MPVQPSAQHRCRAVAPSGMRSMSQVPGRSMRLRLPPTSHVRSGIKGLWLQPRSKLPESWWIRILSGAGSGSFSSKASNLGSNKVESRQEHVDQLDPDKWRDQATQAINEQVVAQ